jgi:hypothetical protein
MAGRKPAASAQFACLGAVEDQLGIAARCGDDRKPWAGWQALALADGDEIGSAGQVLERGEAGQSFEGVVFRVYWPDFTVEAQFGE